MARLFKPPQPIPHQPGERSLFLAGSIEMGRAINWQAEVENALQALNILIFNPRRDDWDETWEQHRDNPQFREQVTWELTAQEQADLIAMYFAPDTKSPITLLELGLFAQSGKLLVCCPDGFWRKGNVDIVCQRYGVPLIEDLVTLIETVKQRFADADKETV